jgi:hypothetical protein
VTNNSGQNLSGIFIAAIATFSLPQCHFQVNHPDILALYLGFGLSPSVPKSQLNRIIADCRHNPGHYLTLIARLHTVRIVPAAPPPLDPTIGFSRFLCSPIEDCSSRARISLPGRCALGDLPGGPLRTRLICRPLPSDFDLTRPSSAGGYIVSRSDQCSAVLKKSLSVPRFSITRISSDRTGAALRELLERDKPCPTPRLPQGRSGANCAADFGTMGTPCHNPSLPLFPIPCVSPDVPNGATVAEVLEIKLNTSRKPLRVQGGQGTFEEYVALILPKTFDVTDFNQCHCLVVHRLGYTPCKIVSLLVAVCCSVGK